MNVNKTVGIIGAGKISMALAKHLIAAGYHVLISARRPPHEYSLILEVMVPGAKGVTTDELAAQADIIILALPLSKIADLPLQKLAGKLVIDATNHWLEVDGNMPDLQQFEGTTSQYVQHLLPQSRVVKAFNHLGYHDVDQKARPNGHEERLGMAIAGEHQSDLGAVAELVDAVGFDPVHIGALQDTEILQGGHQLFGATVTATEILALTQQDSVVA